MWRYGFKMTFWFVAVVALIGLAVMQLWNWLIPELFNGNMINYWQALGVLVLARLLTGFGRGGHHYWKYKMRHKWTNLSDEDREALRQKFKDRWCNKTSE